MRFSITREALLKPLQVVSGVVEKRQTLPILSNVLVTIEAGKLTLVGTDLEVELLANTNANDADNGEVTLPARKFMDICRALPDESMVEVNVEGERATVRSGRSRFTLATLPATEFPATEPVAGTLEFSVPQHDLKRLIDQTQFSMANQDVRYYLNGLLLEVNSNGLRAVATDGHRLAVCDANLDIENAEPRQVIVPRKGVSELVRLLEDSDDLCHIQLNNNFIKIVVDDVTMTSKLIDGRFPDYERVLPKDTNRIVVAERHDLRQTLLRTSILSNEKYRGVRLSFEPNRLCATVNNPEQEEAEEDLEVQYNGESFEIGFNVSYLLDALNAVKQDQVELSMTDSNSSCLINGVGDDSSRYVVMPMRL